MPSIKAKHIIVKAVLKLTSAFLLKLCVEIRLCCGEHPLLQISFLLPYLGLAHLLHPHVPVTHGCSLIKQIPVVNNVAPIHFVVPGLAHNVVNYGPG